MIKKEKLRMKGWTEEEIIKAEHSLETELKHDAHFSKIVFWTSLVIVIIANILVSLMLIPFLIVLNKIILYSIVVILAGVIGFLYTFLIRDIGHLDKKHHVLAGIIIPIIALANVFVMVVASNQFIKDVQAENGPHSPWLTGIVFAVVFIIPYLIDLSRGRLRSS